MHINFFHQNLNFSEFLSRMFGKKEKNKTEVKKMKKEKNFWQIYFGFGNGRHYFKRPNENVPGSFKKRVSNYFRNNIDTRQTDGGEEKNCGPSNVFEMLHRRRIADHNSRNFFSIIFFFRFFPYAFHTLFFLASLYRYIYLRNFFQYFTASRALLIIYSRRRKKRRSSAKYRHR